MRIHPGIRYFSIVTRNGWHRQFHWRWLLPILITPLILVAALLFFDRVVLLGIRNGLDDPAKLTAVPEFFVHKNLTAIKNLIAAKPERQSSAIPTLNLIVPKNTLLAMQQAMRSGSGRLGHAPGGLKPYFKAIFIDEEQNVQRCKICLRGLDDWHHQAVKPSLRVKIRKSNIRNGRRYVELQRPEDVLALKNWLPVSFGRHLGLLSDMADHVRLFINKKYFGVYLRTMRAGEAMAIENGRMPGTFFKGDAPHDNLWTSSRPWRISGEEDQENIAAFDRFLEVLRATPSVETMNRLERLLDVEVYARWAALMIVTGSVHTDIWHNHLYFLCSNQGKLEAVPWDCNSYGIHTLDDSPVDVIRHPVMDRITRDPRWVHRRNQMIQLLLETDAEPDHIHRFIDHTVDRLLPDLEADVNLHSVHATKLGWTEISWSVLDIEPKRREIKEFATRRYRFLKNYLANARVFIEPDASHPGWSRVTVAGSVAVNVQDADGQPIAADSYAGTPSLLYPGLSEHLYNFTREPPERWEAVRYAKPAPMVYHVQGQPDDLRFTNAITGEPVLAVSGPANAASRRLEPARIHESPTSARTPIHGSPNLSFDGEIRTIHPSLFPAPATGDVILGPGEVVLERDIVTERGQRLIIRAGTQIRLRKGVGIYARGLTLVQGKPGKKVELRPADNAPWAAFGISGAATRGSRFEYMHVTGGSVGSDGSVRFKGMFNVYNSPDVTLRHCRFGENKLGDDAVNLAESRIRIEHCEWENARADGLDLDMCEGTIRDSRWRHCGNDGLDLMTCRVTVENSRFDDCADKGISVGENSRLIVRHCTINRCHIGLENKDASLALVRETTFDGNETAVHAYQKKWLYRRGGSTALVSCNIRNSSEADLSIEKRCDVWLVQTALSNTVVGEERVVTIPKLPPEWDELMSREE